MLTILIVDDEPVARRRIHRLLTAEPDVSIVGDCADGASALKAIVRERPDVVFLDVQMPELDGFEVLRQVPSTALPAIVFVTAFDRYALRAFDVHAIDYLLKPFTAERFRTALGRARDRVARRDPNRELAALVAELRARPRYLSRAAARVGGRIVLVDLATVDWIEAADNYVRLHAGGREYLLRDTLTAFERQLDPSRFARIHRSAIVQLDRVMELHPATHGDLDVRLRDGTKLTLSRTWRERLERALGRTP
jgi:two-component system, LytTR family, response regulator